MGSSQSTGVSAAAWKNDFELAVRATKELDGILVDHFGAPNGKDVGLHQKISDARVPSTNEHLPAKLQKSMRYLVTIRNAIVHDRNVNAIEDKNRYRECYTHVERELLALRPAAQKKAGCVIC